MFSQDEDSVRSPVDIKAPSGDAIIEKMEAEYIGPEATARDVDIASEATRGDRMAVKFMNEIPAVLAPFGSEVSSIPMSLPTRNWVVGGGYQEKLKSTLAEDYKKKLAEDKIVNDEQQRVRVERQELVDNFNKDLGRKAKAQAENAEYQRDFVKDAGDKARQRYNVPPRRKRTNPYHFNMKIGY